MRHIRLYETFKDDSFSFDDIFQSLKDEGVSISMKKNAQSGHLFDPSTANNSTKIGISIPINKKDHRGRLSILTDKDIQIELIDAITRCVYLTDLNLEKIRVTYWNWLNDQGAKGPGQLDKSFKSLEEFKEFIKDKYAYIRNIIISLK
jgi:hypothetical protein